MHKLIIRDMPCDSRGKIMICNCIGFRISTMVVFKEVMMECDEGCGHQDYSDSDDSFSSEDSWTSDDDEELREIKQARQTIL
jgi:hypothetical protein